MLCNVKERQFNIDDTHMDYIQFGTGNRRCKR